MHSGKLLGMIAKLWPIARMAYRLVMIVQSRQGSIDLPQQKRDTLPWNQYARNQIESTLA